MRAMPGRLIVTSRGTNEMAGGIVINERNLVDSDICTREDGTRIIRKSGIGEPLGDCRYIISDEDVYAVEVDGEWQPIGTMMIVRKCLDPEDESGIELIGDRHTRFAEILAVGPKTHLKDAVGAFAYVDDSKEIPQKIEETIDDWLIPMEIVPFITGEIDE